MKILISGGAGFIGSRLAKALISRDHQVVCMDSLSPQIHGENPRESELFQYLPAEATFVEGDVRNHGDWIRALEGVDAVVHYAAETGTGQSMYEIERYVDVNVRGTAILLEILARKEKTINKLVVASSRSIYGEGRYKSSAGIVYPGARLDADMAAGDFECKCPVSGGPVELMATDENSLIHPSSIYGITKQNQEQMVLAMAPACG
ncbi:MAG: NAD-dependent epimerase/dehydratase family protein, partial [Pseudomonadales bacterium]|nr:NAD-dependent epimerase/dehydratase family protein [Pseudomonadales bacterium]